MAPNKIPGPEDPTRKPVDVNDGTSPRVAMAPPGTVSAQTASAAAAAAPAISSPAAAADKETKDDPEIEALNLTDTAKKAAYALKKKHPAVSFTSGKRDKDDQARAMAGNVVLNRNWIKETYTQSAARDACQKWVDDNKGKKTEDEISTGLKGVLDGLTDGQLAQLSKHLSGEAFDVQPVEKDAEEIKKTIQAFTDQAQKDGNKHAKFLEKEGGLVRWHAQF